MNSDTSRQQNSMTARLRAAIAESKVGRFSATISLAIENSAISRAGQQLSQWVQQSYLFRWLTAEPEPEVIVVDLRESWFVGPVIAALDRFTKAVVPAVETSRVRRATKRLTARLSRAPLRFAGLAGVVAFSALVAAALLTGTLTRPAMGAYAICLGLALAGTRVELSWRELGETKIGKAVSAAFVPPEYDD